jgi:prolipoprotein diacylglyceryltransferase
MIEVFFLKIPIYLISLFVAGFFTGFILWRNKSELFTRGEQVFDLVALVVIFSLVLARIFYVLENFERIDYQFWSFYPYEYSDIEGRIWFTQMPWKLIKFWDNGILFSALYMGGSVVTLLYIWLRKVSWKFTSYVCFSLVVGHIFQAIGSFIAGDYFGKETTSFFSLTYGRIDDLSRIPVQGIEIIVFCLLIAAFIYLKEKKRNNLFLGLYMFILGWLQIGIQFLIDKNTVGQSLITPLNIGYIVFIVLGIVLMIISPKEFDEAQAGLYKQGKGNMKIGQQDQKNYSYRDFQSTYSAYKKSRTNTLQQIKRRIFKKKSES